MSNDIQITNIKEVLTEMVAPSIRPNVNIIPDHITMLHGTKSKKQLNRKRKTNKSTTLNRREFQQLGLHTLPTKLLKYKDVLPLHKLWKGYIKEHLNLKNGDSIPEVYEPNYDAFSKLLVKSDLHGAKLTVIKSKCPTLVGLSGIVVLDTKNVLKIVGEDNKLRTIPKSECIFGMQLGNITFTLFGKHLNIRSAERSVKKIKNFIEPDLIFNIFIVAVFSSQRNTSCKACNCNYSFRFKFCLSGLQKNTEMNFLLRSIRGQNILHLSVHLLNCDGDIYQYLV